MPQRRGDNRPHPHGRPNQHVGRCGQEPRARRGHDQVGQARTHGRRDQGASTAEPGHEVLRCDAADEAPYCADGDEETECAFLDPPLSGGKQDQDARLHSLEPGQSGDHHNQEGQASVSEEEPHAFRHAASCLRGLVVLGAELGEGETREDERRRVGHEGECRAERVEPGPDGGARQALCAELGAGQHPVRGLQGLGHHEVGDHRLSARVIDGAACRVDEHHGDQEQQGHPAGHDENHSHQDDGRTQRVRQSRDRATIEAVGEVSGRQSHE